MADNGQEILFSREYKCDKLRKVRENAEWNMVNINVLKKKHKKLISNYNRVYLKNKIPENP